jgi:hypothetical protein
MCQASTKDFATYFQRALASGLCRESDVKSWVEEMTGRCAGDVPKWLRDLSVAPSTNKERLLDAVPGESNDEFVWKLMFASLGRSFREHWLNNGQVVYLLLSWAVAGTVPEEYRRVAYLFDDHHEGIGPGWFAEEELRKEMATFFEQFHAYEPLLPTSPQASRP